MNKIRRDTLDDLFSQVVRMSVYSDGEASCEYCGRVYHDTVKDNGETFEAWKHLECSHFKGRRRVSTRHDLDNCAALCKSCHRFLGENPDTHTAFFKKRLGSDKYDNLQARANTICKLSKADKEEIKARLKSKLAILKEE